MEFYLDTANVDEIRKANDCGVIKGVTTNPSLIAKSGRDFNEVIKDFTFADFRSKHVSDIIETIKKESFEVKDYKDFRKIKRDIKFGRNEFNYGFIREKWKYIIHIKCIKKI